jgi:hypothetical protein
MNPIRKTPLRFNPWAIVILLEKFPEAALFACCFGV